MLWFWAIAAGLAAGVLASTLLHDSGAPAPLSLEAREQSGLLLVRWNAGAATASSAQRAVITLAGADSSVELLCDRACLAHGSISYPRPQPASTIDVGMRFTDATGRATEERTRLVAAAVPDNEQMPEPD